MKTIIKYLSLSFFILLFSNSTFASNNDPAIDLDALRLLSQAFTRIKKNFVDEVSDKELVDSCIAGMTSGDKSAPLYSGKEQVDDSDVNLEAIRFLSQAYVRIKKRSTENDKNLIENCITAMAKSLDSESQFLGAEKFQELKSGSSFLTGGVGLMLRIRNGYPLVVSPIDGTPAYQEGIKSGDVILQIENQDMHGVSLDEVVSKLRGKPGTHVQLKVARNSKPDNMRFNLKREQIRIISVKEKLLENSIGYIRISAFRQNTGSKFKDKLTQLARNTDGDLKGLIIDLRNNPGGLVSEAIAVADTFLDSGMIAYTEGRHSQSGIKYMADKAQYLKGIPLVILVNEGTAASSEIVSGALKDHRRATILGKKTFGSGSIQTIMPLGNNSALKLTTARWLTPSGDFIHGWGIKPDVVVDESSNEHDDAQLKRALLYLNR